MKTTANTTPVFLSLKASLTGPHCMSPWIFPINSTDCRQVMAINRFCMSTHNLPILKLYAMLWFYSSIVCESGALVRIRRTYSDPVKYLASSLHGCMGWCGGFPPSSLSCWERRNTIVNLTRFIWNLKNVGALRHQVVMIYKSRRDHIRILIWRSQQLREEGGNSPHHPIQPCSELARCLTGSLYVPLKFQNIR